MGALALYRRRLSRALVALMPAAAEIARNSFASGEVSKALWGRADLQKAQAGVKFLENMVVLLEGGVTRCPGTQMVLQLVAGHAYVGIPFRFSGSGSNAYLIVIGNGVAKFILGNAVVQAIGGGDYTVVVPYTDADLGGAGATIPGVSNLRYSYSGNVIYLWCDGHLPQTLTRNADNSWTLASYLTQPAVPAPQGGSLAPTGTENIDPTQTIGVNGLNGAITLTASTAFAGATATVPNGFQAGHVGSVWKLGESNLSFVPEWQANETISPANTRLLPNSPNYFTSMANPGNAFDGNSGTYAFELAGVGFIGGQLNAPATIITATITGPFTNGFWNSNLTPEYLNFTLYANKNPPANLNDGVILAAGTIGIPGRSITLTSNDQLTQYGFVWITWTNTVNTVTIGFTEVDFEGLVSTSPPTLRRWNGNVYQALTSGNAGTNPPVHTSGQVLSGNGGIQWLYRNRGYGFVQITAVTSSTIATANVLETIPDSVFAQPTANWWPSAWDGVQGWPNRSIIALNSLWTAFKNRFWRTQPGTFNNWDIPDPTSAQSGIAGGLISPTGSLPWIEWFFSAAFLATGTRDEEWTMAGQDPLSAVTVENLSPYPSRQTGSAQHIPAVCEGGIVTINRARDRAMFMTVAFNGVSPAVAEEELTISARHILGQQGGGALGVSRQQDPNCINWFWCTNGLVVGNTLMKEQGINAWHRHPQHAPTNSQVNDIVTIPSSDEGKSWTYFLTTRTINGQQAQFVELLQPFFGQVPGQAEPVDATNAWFLDCALQYTGPPVQIIGGLNHLIGQAVGVHADGCTYLNLDGSLPVVNNAGQITLSRPTQNAIVGLPKSYRVRTLAFDMNTARGTDTGEKQKANHLYLRVMYSAGGQVAVNPDEGGLPEPLEEPGTLQYGTAIPLRTGILRTPGLEVPLAEETVVEVSSYVTPNGVPADTMPFTLLGIDPDVQIVEST